MIRANGMLFMPMIKNGIQVKGLSTAQVSEKLKKNYIKTGIYTAPIIDVLSLGGGFSGCILTKCSEIISIGGHVKSPGPKPFIAGMTLSHALAAAGGATPFGAPNRIELYRNHKKTIYNLRELEHQKVKLQLGDSINIPQKKIH